MKLRKIWSVGGAPLGPPLLTSNLAASIHQNDDILLRLCCGCHGLEGCPRSKELEKFIFSNVYGCLIHCKYL